MNGEDDFEYDDFEWRDDADAFGFDERSEDEIEYDALSAEELFELALGDLDFIPAWSAISALQRRATDEVFAQARTLCFSHVASEREVGAYVLGQFGGAERTHAEEIAGVLHAMLPGEIDIEVLQAILTAFSHNEFPGTVDVALDYASHPDADVRKAVVSALTGRDDPRALAQLIELTSDLEADIRNWSTFAIGTQTTADDRDIREALAARLDDLDEETRGEALIGLARRKDERALAVIRAELAYCPTALVVEAAGLTQAREFAGPLIRLRGSESLYEHDLETAIMACSGRAFEWN